MGEDWEGCTCHLVSHRIDIFYLLNSWSRLTLIITYFQTCEHEKWITTFFSGYFPSPSICHKNFRFCWKLLWSIIYFLKLEKLRITFFQGKVEKCEFVTTDIYRYTTDISYTYVSIYLTQYIDIFDIYIDISLPSLILSICLWCPICLILVGPHGWLQSLWWVWLGSVGSLSSSCVYCGYWVFLQQSSLHLFSSMKVRGSVNMVYPDLRLRAYVN